VAASTREGEEADVLAALAVLDPRVLLVLVPRHPQRFDTVAATVAAAGLRFSRRSGEGGIDEAADASVRVLLGDSMGEMAAWYAAADLAFVGGSLRPLGGQNLIEPCALGCPVLVGPHTWNFREAAEQAVAAGAALRVADAAELGRSVAELLADRVRRATMAEAGRVFAQVHRGATERTLQALLPPA
jgi:3-deoxy-D-manno-octulosonic-acid transferase